MTMTTTWTARPMRRRESGTYDLGGDCLPDLLDGAVALTEDELRASLARLGYVPVEGYAGWGAVYASADGSLLSVSESGDTCEHGRADCDECYEAMVHGESCSCGHPRCHARDEEVAS